MKGQYTKEEIERAIKQGQEIMLEALHRAAERCENPNARVIGLQVGEAAIEDFGKIFLAKLEGVKEDVDGSRKKSV